MSIHAQDRRAARERGPVHGILAPMSAAQLRDLLTPPRPSAYAGGSIVLLHRCPVCREWMREGSAALGRCVDCWTPRD